MSHVVALYVVRVIPASARGDVTVIETFAGIEHREELKVVAQGVVEAGAKNVGSAADIPAEFPGSGAALRVIAGAAVLNAESVVGR
jgi:hypothetical protein